jgi:hypothetical protein
MGEKDELNRFFIGEKEIDTSGIPELPGDLINYSLQSVGKELEFRTEFELPKEIFYSLFFSNLINQNNFRKIHGFPKKRKIAGRKGVRKHER